MKNVSELISKQASLNPLKESITVPVGASSGYKYISYTFKELEERINQFCHKLTKLGVRPGDKVLFFVKPNIDFCAITFALFRMGAISVFIDPGMKKRYFFQCIQELKPDVIIGIPAVHILRRVFYKYFKCIRVSITTGSWGILTPSIYKGLSSCSNQFNTYIPKRNDLAAILYTSGGTGKPKGVEYTHDIFINQTKMLQNEFELTEKDVDIPGFPLFSFFTLAMGMKSVVPDMDFAKPSACNPQKLYQNISDTKATFVAGSPAIWERLAVYCHENNLTLPSVKYLVMFGAPVKNKIHEYFKAALPNGTSYTPYGATECLPIANISGREILASTAAKTADGKGTCVGKLFAGVKVKIIQDTDKEIKKISDCIVLPKGSIGEIIVHSPNVTRAYYQNQEATKLSKIYDGENVWHRMGDMGYLDQEGLIWFCGRKKHKFKVNNEVIYPIMLEQVVNTTSIVSKSAVVLHTKIQKPVLVVEAGQLNLDQKNAILKACKENKSTQILDEVYSMKKLPVDTRHNIKIDRSLISHIISESV